MLNYIKLSIQGALIYNMVKTFKRHYYNNGKIQIKSENCPEGFVRGMLPRSKEHSEKIRQTRIKNNSYKAWNKGIKCPMTEEQAHNMIEKRNETMRKNNSKYGKPKGSDAWNKGLKNPYPLEVNKQISNTLKLKYASGEIISKTLGKKATPETIEKLRISHLGKKLSPEKLKEANKKRYYTLKKNKTFHASKIEKEYKKLLISIFGSNDIETEYVDVRYPFKCDFYVRSKDLFIELNIFPTHGKHPFDSLSEEDIQELQSLQKKPQTYINHKGKQIKSWAAVKIYVWTIYDVLKQKIAQENNLNYRCYYSEKEAFDDLINL